MTTATTEGRRLVLRVEGVDDAFYVDPLPARRGRFLTDQFLLLSTTSGEDPAAAQALGEEIFVESLGPVNYSRLTGLVVDLVSRETGERLVTWNAAAEENPSPLEILRHGDVRFVLREPVDGEPVPWGEPIRQEESEALALCAFYWQTVVGMEAVQAFLDAGEGTEGSVKALALLLYRTGRLPSPNSSTGAMAIGTQQGSSSGTSATSNSSGSVRLPAKQPADRKRSRKRSGSPSRNPS